MLVPSRSSFFPNPTPLAAHTHNIRVRAPSRLEVNNRPLFHTSLNVYYWGILYVIYQLFKIKKYKIHCQGLVCPRDNMQKIYLNLFLTQSISKVSGAPMHFPHPLPHHRAGLTLSYSWKIFSGLTLHVRHDPLVNPEVCVLIVKLKLTCTWGEPALCKITHKLGTLWQSIHCFLRILICCIATSYLEYILLNYVLETHTIIRAVLFIF